MTQAGHWPLIKLGDVAEFRNGINYTKKNFGRGIKVVGVSDFQDRLFPRCEELEEINPEGIVKNEDLLQPEDILFVRSNGNRQLIGRSLYLPSISDRLTHSAFTIRVRLVSDRVIPRFYAYVFRTRLIRDTLSAFGGGTNISNLNQAILSSLLVPLPHVDAQRKIAGILSAYDDLIENNRRRIEILEEMARRIYREWFVEFRFPGHENVKFVDSALGKIPEGWEAHTLGDLALQERRGVRPNEIAPGTPYVGLEHLPRRSIALTEWDLAENVGSNKYRFVRGEILFGKIRPYFHKVSVAPIDGVCSTDAIVIRPKTARHFPLVLACVSSDEFVEYSVKTSNGTKMPRANWDVLVKYPVFEPPDPLLDRFNEFVRDSVSSIHNLVSRNRNLQKTRDLLLPRLIAGTLDVSDLPIDTGADDADGT